MNRLHKKGRFCALLLFAEKTRHKLYYAEKGLRLFGIFLREEKRNNVKKRTRYETMRFIAVALICLLVGVLLYTNLHKSSKITLVAKNTTP